MTWKSTAAASGAMLIATWLASYAPVNEPRQAASSVPSIANTETAAAEIQREASRLHERLQQAAAYRQPDRNPFRFGAPRANPATFQSAQPAMTVEDSVAPSAPVVPTLRLALSGIAEDTVNDQLVRTAIISTPDNVFLVKVGEEIAGTYKVASISPDGVELVRIENGATVRLALKP